MFSYPQQTDFQLSAGAVTHVLSGSRPPPQRDYMFKLRTVLAGSIAVAAADKIAFTFNTSLYPALWEFCKFEGEFDKVPLSGNSLRLGQNKETQNKQQISAEWSCNSLTHTDTH
ncbi:uncharacterized [Tachysurus ichikawai]